MKILISGAIPEKRRPEAIALVHEFLGWDVEFDWGQFEGGKFVGGLTGEITTTGGVPAAATGLKRLEEALQILLVEDLCYSQEQCQDA